MTKEQLRTKVTDAIYLSTTQMNSFEDDRVDEVMKVFEEYLEPLRTAFENDRGRPDYHSFLQEFFSKQWPELDEAIATVLEGDDRELPPMKVPKGSLQAAPAAPCSGCGALPEQDHAEDCPWRTNHA